MSKIFEEHWTRVKTALLEGLEDDPRRQNMEKVFDLIKENASNDPKKAQNYRVSLPVVRRVYPALSKELDPKYFVDLYETELARYAHEGQVSGDADFVVEVYANCQKFKSNDFEAVAFASVALRITDTIETKTNN